MTINEACIKVLTELGGKAPLKLICLKVQEIVVFKGATPYNSICTELITHPKNFRRSEGQKGWWELTSYQEEIAERNKEIVRLRAEVERLQNVPTEDDFVKKFIEATKTQFKFKRQEADAVRQIMDKLGRTDAEAILGAWIEGKEQKPTVAIAGNLVINKETNIDKNYGPNIEHNGGTLTLPDKKKE